MENEEKNKSNFANKVFNRQDVLILGGLNSGILLYMHQRDLTLEYINPSEDTFRFIFKIIFIDFYCLKAILRHALNAISYLILIC